MSQEKDTILFEAVFDAEQAEKNIASYKANLILLKQEQAATKLDFSLTQPKSMRFAIAGTVVGSFLRVPHLIPMSENSFPATNTGELRLVRR